VCSIKKRDFINRLSVDLHRWRKQTEMRYSCKLYCSAITKRPVAVYISLSSHCSTFRLKIKGTETGYFCLLREMNTQFSSEKINGRDHMGHLQIDEWIILNWILS
jgi:hypothetical protein